MKTLSFLGFFRDKILKKEKTITVRLGEVKKFKPGELVKIDCGGRIIGIGRIKRVEVKRIKDLTEEEIKKDGYHSISEFLNQLRMLKTAI